jgi:hypothetical protein
MHSELVPYIFSFLYLVSADIRFIFSTSYNRFNNVERRIIAGLPDRLN